MWCHFPPTGKCVPTLSRQKLFLPFPPTPSATAIFTKKVWRTLLIVSQVLLGPAAQFKNWYTVRRPHQLTPLTEMASWCYIILNCLPELDILLENWIETLKSKAKLDYLEKCDTRTIQSSRHIFSTSRTGTQYLKSSIEITMQHNKIIFFQS